MSGILIVDDDPDAGEAMSEVLKLEGFDVSVAADGAKALQALRTGASLPSVILLDLTMPVMNGWQFRREQLNDARLASVPVIVLTATPVAESNVSQLSPVAFLKKPVSIDKLLQLIGSVCS